MSETKKKANDKKDTNVSSINSKQPKKKVVYKLLRIFNVKFERYSWCSVDADYDILTTLPTGDFDKLNNLLTEEYFNKYSNFPYNFYAVVKFRDEYPVDVPFIKWSPSSDIERDDYIAATVMDAMKCKLPDLIKRLDCDDDCCCGECNCEDKE